MMKQADELTPNNKDIQKQLKLCREDKSIKQNSLDSYIQDVIQEMEKCCKEGNTNEATSYAYDIYEFRPTDTQVLKSIAEILEEYRCWKEVAYFTEKLFTITKSLEYLKKRIHAEMNNVCFPLIFILKLTLETMEDRISLYFILQHTL